MYNLRYTAMIFLISSAWTSAASASMVCENRSPDFTVCSPLESTFPRLGKQLELERRVIDSRSHLDRFTFGKRPDVEKRTKWPLGPRQACKFCLAPTIENLRRLNQLKQQ